MWDLLVPCVLPHPSLLYLFPLVMPLLLVSVTLSLVFGLAPGAPLLMSIERLAWKDASLALQFVIHTAQLPSGKAWAPLR